MSLSFSCAALSSPWVIGGLVILVVLFLFTDRSWLNAWWWRMHVFSSSPGASPMSFSDVAAAPADLLSTGKETFVSDAAPAPTVSVSGATSAAMGKPSTIEPSELLPSDGNTMWSTVGSGNNGIAGQIVPAELMDPTRMPNFTSTTKSKIPNQQWWRPDPLVDRSISASQWFNQTPDTHQDTGAGNENPNVVLDTARATTQF